MTDETPAPTGEVVHSIKGFGLDWKCLEFQFEMGKTYDHAGPVKVCNSGFHAIEGHPLEVFQYYPPGKSRYADVTQSGAISRDSGDSKIASAKITIDAELNLPKLVECAIAWITSRTTPAESKHAEGDQSAASSTGYQSAASSTGYQSAAMSSGRYGRAMGAKGCALFLVYRDDDWNIVHAWAGIAGRDGIKPLCWYQLDADGKPREVGP